MWSVNPFLTGGKIDSCNGWYQCIITVDDTLILHIHIRHYCDKYANMALIELLHCNELNITDLHAIVVTFNRKLDDRKMEIYNFTSN